MGVKSPLTFTLDVPEYYKKADFTLYFSLNKNQFPGKENCDRMISRKQKFTYKAPHYIKKF